MGYTAVKDISANVLSEVLTLIEENEEDKKHCIFKINGVCFASAPFISDTPLTKAECEAQKGELGLKYCYTYSAGDYYAGAVKKCKDEGARLPNQNELAKIASYVYNTNVTPSGEVHAERHHEKLSQLGFRIDPGSEISIWSDQEISSDLAHLRRFHMSYTYWYQFYRSTPDQTFCVFDEEDEEPEPVEYAKTLCEEIEKTYNIKESNCTVPVTKVTSAASKRDFSEITPHIILSNGLRLYIGSEYEEIEDLSDSTDAEDKEGFIIYIDVNGTTGKGKLYEDVFPYILLKSGKVVPAYEADNNSGGTNKEHLSINVLYDTYTSGSRQVNLLLRDANFRKAACTTGYVTSKKYCGTSNVQYDVCKEVTHDCRLIINRPLKIF